ncbi:hypothetical protein [Kitasatospora sp. NPDC093102]|uniref:hypothetical protein n=1 Tax=Kitasatospora sp. NPDC093102 TaxID=3155069 RepID=UPI003434DC91
MSSYTTKLAVAVLAAATALSLTACGSDNAGTPAGTGGTTGAAPAQTGAAPGATAGGAAAGGSADGSTAAPSDAATGGAAGGAGTADASGGDTGAEPVPTAATSVRIGQPATVDFADKTAKATIKLEITVTGVEAGSVQDFTAAKLSVGDLGGHTPMYVSYTIKNLGDASISSTVPDLHFVLFDTTGKKGRNVFSAAAPLPKCTGAKFQGMAKGTEVKGCTIITTPGKTPAVVGYADMVDRSKLQASWTK